MGRKVLICVCKCSCSVHRPHSSWGNYRQGLCTVRGPFPLPSSPWSQPGYSTDRPEELSLASAETPVGKTKSKGWELYPEAFLLETGPRHSLLKQQWNWLPILPFFFNCSQHLGGRGLGLD